jgi:transposase
LRYRYWEHLSVISAITAEGDLYTMTHDKAIDSDAVVRFLKHLLRHLSGKLLIIWDGLPAHRSRKVKDFLREGGAARVHLAQLPSYAPDLNPDEATWYYLKNVELRNVCCHSLRELRDEMVIVFSQGPIIPSFRQGRNDDLGSLAGTCLSDRAFDGATRVDSKHRPSGLPTGRRLSYQTLLERVAWL